MATLTEIMDALAGQIEDVLCGTADPLIERLQVDGRLIPNPTPPAIDVYPADPFQEPLTYGKGNNELFFLVRARVSTADNEAGQDLLLSMMDPKATTSMIQAVLSDRTLGGVVERIGAIESPSGYGVFVGPGSDERLIGCTWRVRVMP